MQWVNDGDIGWFTVPVVKSCLLDIADDEGADCYVTSKIGLVQQRMI